MRKGFMHLNEDAKVVADAPGELGEWITALEKAFEEDDYATWDYYHEYIGEYAKNQCSAGEITSEQRNLIWDRYCTAG